MRKLLKNLLVVQEVPNKGRRLNPYNPLSYLTVLLTFVVGVIMFGVVGFWKEVDLKNPFKWN